MWKKIKKCWFNLSRCVPRKWTVFYGIGRAYRFGFGEAFFPRKVPRRSGLRWGVLVVVGRVGWGNYSEKFAVLVDWVEFARKRSMIFVGGYFYSHHAHLHSQAPPGWKYYQWNFCPMLQLYGILVHNHSSHSLRLSVHNSTVQAITIAIESPLYITSLTK